MEKVVVCFRFREHGKVDCVGVRRSVFVAYVVGVISLLSVVTVAGMHLWPMNDR